MGLDGEVQMEDTAESNSEDNNVPVPSPEIVAAIEEMGFSTNAAKRACLAVKNSDAAAATEWIFQHMDDPDLNDPLPTPEPQKNNDGKKMDFDAEVVSNLSMLGFPPNVVKKALRETDNNPERAADWLFSHPDEQGDDEEDEMQIEENQGTSSSEEIRERKSWSGKYRLKGFISHVGSNFNCGHYVAHIKKDGEWAIFDDSKVAKSEDPPLSHGYLYFYEAVE